MTENKAEELVAVIHIFRHGQRGPLSSSYPTDPYKNHSYEPIKKEELTTKGKKHMYELGQSVRERYRDFLPASYSQKDYRIYTSEKIRSIVSAQLYSAGLFPPTETEIWDEDIRWNPIPTFMAPQPVLRDFPQSYCPAYIRALQPFLDELWDKFKNDPVVECLVRNSGLETVDFTQVCLVQETLKTQKSFGLQLPAWAEEILPKVDFIMEYANVMTKTDEMKTLFVGCFLNEIIQHFKKMRADPFSGPKLLTYSGHDTNLINLLIIFGAFDNKSPVFGGGIFFELWKKNGEYYVNIYHQKEDIKPLTIEEAEFDCKFDEFVDILSRHAVTLEEFYKICD